MRMYLGEHGRPASSPIRSFIAYGLHLDYEVRAWAGVDTRVARYAKAERPLSAQFAH